MTFISDENALNEPKIAFNSFAFFFFWRLGGSSEPSDGIASKYTEISPCIICWSHKIQWNALEVCEFYFGIIKLYD